MISNQLSFDRLTVTSWYTNSQQSKLRRYCYIFWYSLLPISVSEVRKNKLVIHIYYTCTSVYIYFLFFSSFFFRDETARWDANSLESFFFSITSCVNLTSSILPYWGELTRVSIVTAFLRSCRIFLLLFRWKIIEK